MDAKASKSRTGIGSWSPEVDHTGKILVWESRWYERGWVCEKGDKPALIIATLEALAPLVTLEDFYGDVPNSTMTKVVPSWTDNWGNGDALRKLMTTKFRVGRLHGVVNLHEEDRAGRRSDRRRPLAICPIPADPDHVGVIMPVELDAGRSAEHEHQQARQWRELHGRGNRAKRRTPKEKLRIGDHWWPSPIHALCDAQQPFAYPNIYSNAPQRNLTPFRRWLPPTWATRTSPRRTPEATCKECAHVRGKSNPGRFRCQK